MRRFYRSLFNRELDNVYLANIFFSFHTFLLVYINSPFLAQFMSARAISGIYIAGAALNILLMVSAPRLIAHFGIRRFALSVIGIEGASILGMVTTGNPFFIGVFFVMYQALILVIAYILDLFLERATRNETYTGRIRSIFLTIANAVLVTSPLIVSIIVGRTEGFAAVYILGTAALVPLLCIIGLDLPKTGIGDRHVSILHGLRTAWNNAHIRSITLARFVLEFFYGWMVIYMALYLHTVIGFSWGTIGVLFSIMLLPFLIFSLPLGTVSDTHANEKEIVIIGFGIAAVATALIPFLETPRLLEWAVLLFATRVGASFVEMGSESYFFKHVNARDTNMVSVFRLTRPLGFIAAPVVVLVAGIVFEIDHTFFILALIMLAGLVPALWMKETRS